MGSFKEIAIYLAIAVALVNAQSINVDSIDDINNEVNPLGTEKNVFGKLNVSNIETNPQMNGNLGENLSKFESPDVGGNGGTPSTETDSAIEDESGADQIPSLDLGNSTPGTGVDVVKGTEVHQSQAFHEHHDEHHNSESSSVVDAGDGIGPNVGNEETIEEGLAGENGIKSEKEVPTAFETESDDESPNVDETVSDGIETKTGNEAKSEVENDSDEEENTREAKRWLTNSDKWLNGDETEPGDGPESSGEDTSEADEELDSMSNIPADDSGVDDPEEEFSGAESDVDSSNRHDHRRSNRRHRRRGRGGRRHHRHGRREGTSSSQDDSQNAGNLETPRPPHFHDILFSILQAFRNTARDFVSTATSPIRPPNNPNMGSNLGVGGGNIDVGFAPDYPTDGYAPSRESRNRRFW